MRIIAGAVMLGIIIALSGVAPALGAQMHALVDPNIDTSSFEYVYQRTFVIEPVEEESPISEFLNGTEWILEGTVDSSDPGVQKLVAELNRNILSDRSIATVDDITVDYKIHLTGRDTFTSIDYKVILDGTLTNYLITQDQYRSLVDMGWRAISSVEPVVIDDVDVNIPLNMLQIKAPEIYDLVANSEAADIFSMPIINADFIQEQPITNWHQLTDAVGINQHAMQYGLSDALAGKVFNIWTMGESSIREGRQVEIVWEASVTDNNHPTLHGDYDVRAIQSADIGSLVFMGYATPDDLDGIEIMGVTPNAPEGIGPATGGFPVMIIYGMAGMAAVGGGLFFMFSNRALKNEKEGQQGIDPSRLVGHQTSAASGGYQTNRGEAQLRDQSEYQQTRSYYDKMDTYESSTQVPEYTPPSSTVPAVDATCACSSSAESGMECDCQMQGSCLCDATCQCSGDVCISHVFRL